MASQVQIRTEPADCDPCHPNVMPNSEFCKRLDLKFTARRWTSSGRVFAAEEGLIEGVDAGVEGVDAGIQSAFHGVYPPGQESEQREACPDNSNNDGDGVCVHEPYPITWGSKNL